GDRDRLPPVVGGCQPHPADRRASRPSRALITGRTPAPGPRPRPGPAPAPVGACRTVREGVLMRYALLAPPRDDFLGRVLAGLRGVLDLHGHQPTDADDPELGLAIQVADPADPRP